MDLTKKHYEETPLDFQEVRMNIFKTSYTYEILNNYNLTGKLIVDVGCGIGFIGDYIKKHYLSYLYEGIDISPKSVKIARSKGLNVVEGNNLSLDLPNNHSDLTISAGVIHHTSDPYKCFKELIRITKNGGLIDLYVYNRNGSYFYVYTFSSIIRLINKYFPKLIKKIVFPVFNLCYIQLGNKLFYKSKNKVPRETVWNIFYDQILNPVVHFFTKKQIKEFAESNGLEIVKEKYSTNKQGLRYIFKKNATDK